jgi:drug/metabolite transporter (DMT)-like permease
MNRSFLLVLAPALLAALIYLGLGYRPRWWALAGAIGFVAALVIVLRRQAAKKG